MGVTKVYVHPLSEGIRFGGFYPNLLGYQLQCLRNSGVPLSHTHCWKESKSLLHAGSQKRGVCSLCHNVVKRLRLFVKKSFDLNEDRRGDREAGLRLPPLFGFKSFYYLC